MFAFRARLSDLIFCIVFWFGRYVISAHLHIIHSFFFVLDAARLVQLHTMFIVLFFLIQFECSDIITKWRTWKKNVLKLTEATTKILANLASMATNIFLCLNFTWVTELDFFFLETFIQISENQSISNLTSIFISYFKMTCMNSTYFFHNHKLRISPLIGFIKRLQRGNSERIIIHSRFNYSRSQSSH